MIVIHYPTAFRSLNEFIDRYNQSSLKQQRLHSSAVLTAKELIRIYGISLLKANGCSSVSEDNLPSLQTNNVQLSKLVKCSTRTIQRHLIKLKKAGFILKKIFHGSNSNYELFINPKILLIKQSIDAEKVKIKLEEISRKAAENDVKLEDLSFEKTKCPHTYDRNNRYINNILIEVEKNFKSDISEPKGYGGDQRGYTGEIAENIFEKEPERAETGEIVSRVEKPESLNLPCDEAREDSLNLYVSLFWMMCRNLLYKQSDLTERQIQIARQLIRKLYEPVTTEKLGNTHQHYIARIALVSKYLKKDPSRYVPLPYIYFDTSNPNGFIGTRKWYYDDKRRKLDVLRELTLSRLIRKYQNNEKKSNSKQKQPLQLFRECENTIGKFGDPSLTERFHAAVLQYETYKQITYAS
jgi:hypothetical protein